MRLVRAVGAAVLVSALTIAVPAFGERPDRDNDRRHGHENHEREKPEKAHPGKQAPPERGHEPHRPERVEHAQPGPRHVEARRDEHVVRHVPEGPRHVEPRYEHRVVWQDRRARNWQYEHHTWVQRGGYHGYFIPRERYAVYFGPAHRFRVHTLPVIIVAGHPRFQYQGYWVSLVDPWPEHWAANWYEADDVYVAYAHDGYYMYNLRHPGVGVAVNISF